VERIAQATPKTRRRYVSARWMRVGNRHTVTQGTKRIAVSAAKRQARQHRTTHDVADDVAHKNKMLNHLLTNAEVNSMVLQPPSATQTACRPAFLRKAILLQRCNGDSSQRERTVPCSIYAMAMSAF